MEHANNKVISFAQLSEDGQITIPAEYCRALALSGHSSLVLVQVGGALVLAPCDEHLTTVTSRLEARMQSAGVTIDDIVTPRELLTQCSILQLNLIYMPGIRFTLTPTAGR